MTEELWVNWGKLSQKPVNLEEFVNLDVLPVRHLLKGFPVSVIEETKENSVSVTYLTPGGPFFAVNKDLVRRLGLDAEELYVVMAHELYHIADILTMKPIRQAMISLEQFLYSVHVDRPSEQRAIFWEAIQAARFGWDRERYRRFIGKIQTTGRYTEERPPMDIRPEEITHRTWAALPVLSRRPRKVHVKRYRRQSR